MWLSILSTMATAIYRPTHKVPDSVRRYVERTSAVITDLDGTLVRRPTLSTVAALTAQALDTKIAEGLKRTGTIDPMDEHRSRTVQDGLASIEVDYLEMEMLIRNKVRKRPTEMDDKFTYAVYLTLKMNKLGTQEEMRAFATKHFTIETCIPVAAITHLKPREQRFLATLAGSTIAQAAASYYELADYICNVDKFDKSGVLNGIDHVISNGQDKLEAVERMLYPHKISLGSSTVIGNDEPDIPMMLAAGLRIAAPDAIDAVKNVSDIVLESQRGIEATFTNLHRKGDASFRVSEAKIA